MEDADIVGTTDHPALKGNQVIEGDTRITAALATNVALLQTNRDRFGQGEITRLPVRIDNGWRFDNAGGHRLIGGLRVQLVDRSRHQILVMLIIKFGEESVLFAASDHGKHGQAEGW